MAGTKKGVALKCDKKGGCLVTGLVTGAKWAPGRQRLQGRSRPGAPPWHAPSGAPRRCRMDRAGRGPVTFPHGSIAGREG